MKINDYFCLPKGADVKLNNEMNRKIPKNEVVLHFNAMVKKVLTHYHK